MGGALHVASKWVKKCTSTGQQPYSYIGQKRIENGVSFFVDTESRRAENV